MCGIAGWYLAEPPPTAAAREALDRLRHRGPDDEGTWNSPPAFLAMRRLAIIDVEGGGQPLFNESRTVGVVANGEIYNFVELRRELEGRGHRFRTGSDAEVLVHLYEDEGEGLCHALAGMYAFALWDEGRRRLLLGRDRFGKKPLYYAPVGPEGLVFASELKALLPLLRAVGKEPEVRPQAIYDYLSLGSVPQPETVYEGVRCLPPASVLTVAGERSEPRSYWALPEPPADLPPYRSVVEQTRRRLGEAVEIRLRSDVPVGVFLSGGIDSGVVAYEAAQRAGGRLEAYTVSIDDPAVDESELAGATARKLGIRHHLLPLQIAARDELERLVEVFDQPFADPSAIPSLAVARMARRHVKVILNGDGGDEVFAGYRRYLAARWADRIGPFVPAPGLAARLLGRSPRRSARGFAARFLRGLALDPATAYLAWTTDMLFEDDKAPAWRGGPVRPTEEWVGRQLPAGAGHLERQATGDRAINLLSGLLVKMDMATMAASLEARSPLLDHRLAELVAPLPATYRLRGGRSKALLRDAYRDALPAAVWAAPKRGFEIPLQRWLEEDLRELVHDALAPSSARIRSWLDGDLVDGIIDGTNFPHRNRAYLLYSLLVLELWLRRWR